MLLLIWAVLILGIIKFVQSATKENKIDNKLNILL